MLVLTIALTGCGADGDAEPEADDAGAEIAAARDVNLADFPRADGEKTMMDVQREAAGVNDLNLAPAGAALVAGKTDRLPFAVFDDDRRPVWGPTVLYVAESPTAPVSGPFAATSHEIDVKQQYRSKTAANDYEVFGNGFFTAMAKMPRAEKVLILAMTSVDGKVHTSTQEMELFAKSPVPEPGERPPAIDTPTIDDVEDIAKIETRVPPDDMHEVSFKDVLGKGKPVVLVMATPALCASRVCGPVVDVAAQVKAESDVDAVFIHQEIFVDNEVSKGFRKQVGQFGLPSEPFTFVIDGKGVVSSVLMGPFSTEELAAALDTAAGRSAR